MQSQLDSWLIHCATAVSLVLQESCNHRHVKCNSTDQYSWGKSLLKVAAKIMFFFHRWDMSSSEKPWCVHHLQFSRLSLYKYISYIYIHKNRTPVVLWIDSQCIFLGGRGFRRYDKSSNMYKRSNEQPCIGHLRLQICCCHKDHKEHGYFRPVVNIYRVSTNIIGKYIRLEHTPTQDAGSWGFEEGSGIPINPTFTPNPRKKLQHLKQQTNSKS